MPKLRNPDCLLPASTLESRIQVAGKIDDFRSYSGALSAGGIADLAAQ
ncbi:MAG: hypothetical protein P8X74_01825 [Reinekea sp.]